MCSNKQFIVSLTLLLLILTAIFSFPPLKPEKPKHFVYDTDLPISLHKPAFTGGTVTNK